jgi:opacity protein-like surface antigen
MRIHTSVLIVFAGLLIFAVSAQAENYYRVEFYGATTMPAHKDFEIGPPQFFGALPGKEKFERGPRGGIRFGVDGSGHWGEEFSYSYGLNDAKILIAPSGEFDFTSRSHQFGYNLVLYPGNSKKTFVPFVTGGVGATIFTVSNKTINEGYFAGLGKLQPHTSFTFNAGAGFRFQINSVYGFRVDVRDYMSHPPRYGIPAHSDLSDALVLPVTGIFHQVETSVAFVIRFKSK